ncbi:hypothetical protein J4Q44_G00030220 [Coregonus suidteri]|uniref:Uncharacterized protein n=1 Tax=Coregonus suidteri TaxID=861788 RepID=A0AAN8MKR0_9TELE
MEPIFRFWYNTQGERRRAKQREGRLWLAGNRRFNPSKRTPRRRLLRRREQQQTRRLQPRQHWSTPVLSVGRRCRTRRHSSSILRASILSPQCHQSWLMLRLKRSHIQWTYSWDTRFEHSN